MCEEMIMTGYAEYYQRAIEQQQNGIKLVLGPTGLGKSSRIPDVVKNNLTHKFIYLANRKQLLQEMATRLEKEHISYVLLQRDLEVVQIMLQTQYEDFEKILADPRFVKALREAKQKYHLKTLESVAIRRACKQVLEITGRGELLPDWLEKQANTQAHIVLQAFRFVLLITRDKEEKSPSYNWFVNHPVVTTLFPAIAFRRKPEIRIMLVTLQKAYYGFFDGAQTRSLTDLSAEKQLILFWDEFDFLESDLVQLICRVPQISDPFDFVAHFYRAMAHHKLPRQEFPLSDELRERIKAIVRVVDEIKDKLNYPDINQFTLTRSLATKMMPSIFRTNHAISSKPLFIHQTDRSYQLELKKSDKNWINAAWYFNRIGLATTLIVALFKELQRENENVYWELMRQCFRNTDFFDQVISIPRLPRHQSSQHTSQRDGLLRSGYGLYEINDLQQRTDDEEVEVIFYQMLQTPENLLFILAQKYLIFALSATADLHRCIHHFDLNWLENRGLLLPITNEDRHDIQQLSEEKARLRKHQMSVTQIDTLNPVDPYQATLENFLHTVTHNDEFDEDTGGYRSQRLHRFFAAFLWLLQNGGKQPRDLLFFNSFRQIRLLFTTFASQAQDAGVYVVEPLDKNPWFQAFSLLLQQKRAMVIFFNAELATQIRQNPDAEKAFAQLFWTEDPVIVVTQYLSAGNGVNLQYTNEEGGKELDFTHIGLLEDPYYFFTKPDPVEQDLEEIFAGYKENIWYQAKLFFSHLISEERFHKVLETIRRPAAWNQQYRTGSTAKDSLFNRLAIFIQALGRVERSWDETSPQVALLCPDVFRVFQAFLHKNHEMVREQREPFASANLKSVLREIAQQTQHFEEVAQQTYDGLLGAKNQKCKAAIHQLVYRLEHVRSAGKDLQARRDWEHLRRAVLSHDFQAEIVRQYECSTSSPYFHRGKLNITEDLDIYPLEVLLPECTLLKLDTVYAIIAENFIIQEHFYRQGFEVKFDHPGNSFFTPYCLQAILAGAIGEEAIFALLTEQKIPIEALPDALFEIVDQRVTGKPWFIDCKNYSDYTLDRFSVPSGDPLWHPSLNDVTFKSNAQAKLRKLIQHSGPESKIMYINLVSLAERPLGYYTSTFQPVSRFEDAQIILVQGALDRLTPNFYHTAFNHFLTDMKIALNIKEENE
jgi:hypothetical protein